ncbi:MAG: extracellular solute-binding protein [Planctomycetes bacterium]|nr:extracellular solute-binding protein [Planctomycetota bacterium]
MAQANKTAQVRSYILNKLEEGKIAGGDKLPGARVLAKKLGMSFLKVQAGLDTLMHDGVLYSIPRQGTFVRENWRELIFQDVLSVYSGNRVLPWAPGLQEMLREDGIDIHLSSAFRNSIFEVRTTLHVQRNHEDYMDLTPFVKDIIGSEKFFQKPFDGFFFDGKLAGVPFLFSPRVIAYCPELFRKAGCDLPYPGWSMEHFLDCISKLCKIMPPQYVIFWYPQAFLFMNFVLRYGGSLVDTGSKNVVSMDSPETLAGLKTFAEIYNRMGRPEIPTIADFLEKFHTGRAAMYIQGRQSLAFFRQTGFDGWDTVPLPACDGGTDATMQATELLCVRKNCADYDLAQRLISFMLSPRVQDHIGDLRYAIPVRKSSAFASINCEDPRDAIFLSEMGKTVNDYRLDNPLLADMVENSIGRIMLDNRDIEAGVRELASAVRALMEINKVKPIPSMK